MTSTIGTRLKMRGIVVLGCWPFRDGVKVFFLLPRQKMIRIKIQFYHLCVVCSTLHGILVLDPYFG